MVEEPISLGLAAISAYGVMLMVNEYMGKFILRLATQQKESGDILEEDKHALVVASLVMFGVLSMIFLKIFEYIISSGAFLIYVEIGIKVNFSMFVLFPLAFTVVYLQWNFLDDLFEKLELRNPQILNALVGRYLLCTFFVLMSSSVLSSILENGYILFIFLVSLYGSVLFIKKGKSRGRYKRRL